MADRLSIETLVAENRTAREALHALVERMRTERPIWKREAFALMERERLTDAQRERFRRQLASWPRG